MFRTLKKTNRGFTLIELLVVIAIIGILSAVVLASLSTARAKARDSKRIADVGQIQLGLELFFDANQSYPTTTPNNSAGTAYTGLDAAVKYIADSTQWTASGRSPFLPKAPVPPAGGTATYIYYGNTNSQASNYAACASGVCLGYGLAVGLERADNSVLSNDADVTFGSSLYGNSANCTANSGADMCYDITP